MIFSYLPINILIALLTPRNILDSSWARSFADSTSHFIPLVAEIEKTANLPELYFAAAAINLMAIIFTVVSICLSFTLDREYLINFMKTRKYSNKDKIRIFLLIPFSVFVFWFILFESHPNELSIIHPLISSKLGMGIYGSFLFGVWLLLGISLLFNYYLYGLLKHNFQEKKNL